MSLSAAAKYSSVALFCLTALANAQSPGPVSVKKGMNTYTLQNAYVTAEVDRATGDLKSLKYSGVEMMGFGSGHHAGYWEQNPSGAAQLTDGVSIDPATNNGARAEVYVKGVAQGRSLSRTSSGGMICDLEIRYTLGKDDRGIYTYAIFKHPASYPETQIGESRFGAKLTNVLDWLSTSSNNNLLMPTGYDWDHGQQMNMKEARRLTTGAFAGKVEHKYDYSDNQFDNPAFGWSSTKRHVGIYFVNPSQEFLSGGPTKYELTAHLDDGAGGDPTLLDYWRSTHYGGSTLHLAAGEEWNKVVGPILVYVNSAATPQAMYADAKREAAREAAMWPFDWVKGVDYPHDDGRTTVTGKLTIQDEKPVAPGRMLVGLIPPGEGDGSWQTDAKHYQFWVKASPDGTFSIPNVRPGSYEVYALADGVFGGYSSGEKVEVTAGKPVALGELAWKPVRYGKQLWEIGVPNRNGSEFLGGDQYNRWGNYLLYAKLFPNDLTYTVGKSDYRRDWYYEQVPNSSHGSPAGGFNGGDTTWTIRFNVAEPAKGVAILRTGLAGVAARHVFVLVNGKPAGDLAPLTYNATINRDGIQGTWTEHDVSFPASLLKVGDNELALRVPSGNVTSGVIYDYLRLELDETGKHAPSASPTAAPAPSSEPDASDPDAKEPR
ncbi:rhamnogalacturonan endolyase [Granulicella rosea]|uniref:rhamnogalacturonan endolyase n=1 Tax=Granulicella rosea TaxID=474952 RepID=A0A239MHL7_9BACT|nr:polysaccharide lyase family protein [Granulicella rosea]SNT41438.1 rhamnogalacturonan endolyase [Granulicella rosea]